MVTPVSKLPVPRAFSDSVLHQCDPLEPATFQKDLGHSEDNKVMVKGLLYQHTAVSYLTDDFGKSKWTCSTQPSLSFSYFGNHFTCRKKAHLFIRFSQQEYGSRSSFPPPRDLPDSEIETVSPASSVLQVSLNDNFTV
ncbi:TPA: hypothetical protein BOS_6503 [Bos taurus]|nr:TPA: hypothetical protein BOS_6503 [Bos taurus]